MAFKFTVQMVRCQLSLVGVSKIQSHVLIVGKRTIPKSK